MCSFPAQSAVASDEQDSDIAGVSPANVAFSTGGTSNITKSSSEGSVTEDPVGRAVFMDLVVILEAASIG